MDSYSFKERGGDRRQKDMSKKLVSKPDVMSSSSDMYLRKIFIGLTKFSVTKILSIN